MNTNSDAATSGKGDGSDSSALSIPQSEAATAKLEMSQGTTVDQVYIARSAALAQKGKKKNVSVVICTLIMLGLIALLFFASIVIPLCIRMRSATFLLCRSLLQSHMVCVERTSCGLNCPSPRISD
jgi:hypothetical protein